MFVPKILVIPGSLRTGSFNVKLAALATKELALADADVTRISLADYPLPIYDADLAKSALPPHALKLKQLVCAQSEAFAEIDITRREPATTITEPATASAAPEPIIQSSIQNPQSA